TERVGIERDGRVEWERRPYWTPLEDPRRGGMVVGYWRSVGGFTEVMNTDGEAMYRYEKPLESVRIPVIGQIEDALKQAGCFAVGTFDSWMEDNWAALGLPPKDHPLANALGIDQDATAYKLGRGAGHVISAIQAVAEIVGGVALIVTGAAE